MAVSSVPKERLVNLIVGELKATNEARQQFHIHTAESLHDRLMSFTKAQLIAFIVGLGPKGEAALRQVQSSFPLRRPPTLYLAVIDNRPSSDKKLQATTRSLAEQGRTAGLDLGEEEAIRFVYVPEPAELIRVGEVGVREIKLHYERRVELIQAEVEAENYGEMIAVYSLETTFVWIPVEKHDHGVIACCDYPALRHILRYLDVRLGLRLKLPWLDTATLQRIVQGAIPRRVTFSSILESEDFDQVQNVTLADPLLAMKKPYNEAVQDPYREQTAGFYINHPGLALGGLGVVRRDGKVWTPKRLDHKDTVGLALTLIAQTERELKSERDPDVLIKHFYGSRVHIGQGELVGKELEAWQELVRAILAAEQSDNKEIVIQTELLERLIRYQERLRLLTAVEHDDCPSCGVKWLAICSRCHNPLRVALSDEFEARCRNCQFVADGGFECDCGEPIEYANLNPLIRVLPERELLESISAAAERFKKSFSGYFALRGTTLKVIRRRQPQEPKRMQLGDLRLWRDRGRFHLRRVSPERQEELRRILNKTREKCRRDDIAPSIPRCQECVSAPLNPDWIPRGDTCLPRLFGVPINEQFDGVHHGQEIADIKYIDGVLNTGQRRRIGIHVKSRDRRPPPEGMGRSKYSIKGLYTQLAFSAFEARVRNAQLDVLGIAIPNNIHKDVLDSMQFVVNELGFSLLVIDESGWFGVLAAAIEQTEIDYAEARR